jgi:hypothetical protein
VEYGFFFIRIPGRIKRMAHVFEPLMGKAAGLRRASQKNTKRDAVWFFMAASPPISGRRYGSCL